MKWKAAVAVLAVIVAALVVRAWRASPRAAGLPTLVLQMRQLQQLVTVRYRLQQVVSMTEQKVPLGTESILLLVQGEALGGVDLAGLTENDVRFAPDRGKVLVRLPQATLTDVFLDEKQTKVWDRHVTWWTPWVPFSPDLETRARQQALADMREAALHMGLLQQAEQNARRAIGDLLSAFQIQAEFAGAQT